MGAVRDIVGGMAAARTLRRRERWSAERIREWQEERVGELVRFAREKSPFYRTLYAGIDPDKSRKLRDLPTVDKVRIMDHFDEVVTDPRLRLSSILSFLDEADGPGAFAGEFQILSTAGTSGRRGIFVLNRHEFITLMAAMLRWQRFIGLRPRLGKRVRVATVGAGNALHASRLLPLAGDVGLHEFRFLEAAAPIDQLVRELNEFQPDLLTPYASVAGLLALEQLAGRLSIRPRIVVTHSEILTEGVALRVEEAWGTRPFNHYGLSEMPCLGIDCAHHRGIHVFEDLCVVEPVTNAGHPVPPGEIADKFYLTNLIYRSQPLIRYEVSDRISLSPSDCPCGSPFSLIRTMEGRDDDTVELGGVEGGSVRIPGLAFILGVEDLPGVVEHEILFDESGPSVEIRILPGVSSPREQIGKAVQEGMEALFERFRAKRPELSVSFVDSFPRDHRVMGKKKSLRKCQGTGRN